MPAAAPYPRVDWTAAMRAAPRVLEYVLVGEMNDGICGQPWATWGYDGEDDEEDEDDDDDGSGTGTGTGKNAAPYARDGFEMVELTDVSAAGQVCRTDERWRRTRQSRTVSFRRMASP